MNPENYNIDVKELVEEVAQNDGVTLDKPHLLTVGTAKLLAEHAVREAFSRVNLGDNVTDITDLLEARTLDKHIDSAIQIADNRSSV